MKFGFLLFLCGYFSIPSVKAFYASDKLNLTLYYSPQVFRSKTYSLLAPRGDALELIDRKDKFKHKVVSLGTTVTTREAYVKWKAHLRELKLSLGNKKKKFHTIRSLSQDLVSFHTCFQDTTFSYYHCSAFFFDNTQKLTIQLYSYGSKQKVYKQFDHLKKSLVFHGPFKNAVRKVASQRKKK